MNFVGLLTEPNFLIAMFASISAAAVVFTFGAQYFDRSDLKRRIKDVAIERERMRGVEMARLRGVPGNDSGPRASLRAAEGTTFAKSMVERFSLRKAFLDETTVEKLTQAGFRGPRHVTSFLFQRFATPIVLFGAALFYLGFMSPGERPLYLSAMYALMIGLMGAYLPNLMLKNAIMKRQASVRKAWPDALDLMLLCVESGMSIEHALKRVAREIGQQSPELAEEMALTTAELAFLENRGTAYENLSKRTGLDGVRAVMTALIQADRYGTSVGTSLRVMAEEGREERMMAAEKKAAALPPKLTVPLIVFFLPVLFIVIISPAMIKVFSSSFSFN